MKIRNGFVSNSSSASFLIKFTSDLDKDELSKYIKDCEIQEDGGIFNIKSSTIMFNDWRDIQDWPFIRALWEDRIDGIKLLDIMMADYEFSNKYEKHEPDFAVWDNDKVDQQKFNSKYSQYLLSIGVEISNEDIKNILSF